MSVLGIDLSTKAVDFVLLGDDDNTAEWLHFQGPTSAKDTKYPLAHYALHYADVLPGRASDFWSREGVWLVGMEALFGPNGRTLKILAAITGAVAACLPRGIRVIEVAPGEWRKQTVGEYQALKWKANAWARVAWVNRTGMETEDALDAYCIARATRALNETAEAA